ncbi:MAG TPA: NADH-ubiquinone oxidoreductase-F iron-sulfur binding region domain-containing protein [Bryobacteraceae bacterium]|nr:NADH-ubiquinone oxidoreductase-F iron-sulfur binding region domain-containing protein [Bryobacteraceae bacterium]
MTGTENIFDRLREIQDQHGYLPAAELQTLSKSSGVPLYHLHGVADFYPHFHLAPPPKVTVSVCSDMSCHLRGADPLRAGLKQRFASMSDRDVSVREVSCLGQCDGAPAASINDRVFRSVNAAQMEALAISALGGSLPHVELGDQGIACGPGGPPPFDLEPYRAFRNLVETRDFNGTIALLKTSGLPGLGGAGFPTGMKWEAVRKAPGPTKYVVCNADESEPGTIKDRFILEHLPHLVTEGMMIAGIVTGAERGILYIRHEYEAQEKILEAEIHRCYEAGLLGRNVLGSGLIFDLEIFVSPGGYICGEETALIEAIEGKRAEPRNKPPFPVISGLWNKPTALNNVETFANVPQILLNGVEWYKSQGQGGAAGLKFVGVSGDVVKPGIFIIPMGLPMSDVIFGHAGGIRDGKRLKAFAPSGPSSGYLPASMVDVRLDFKSLAAIGSMLGSGAIVVCAEGTCMLDMALNACTFFRNESCGKCVPCRMGSQKMVDILTAWTHGKGTPRDLQLVDELSEAMKLASICGLGQFAHSPITSVLKHFREEIEEHIVQHRCPEDVCPMHS